MPKKTTTKCTRVRFRRNSYYKRLIPFATEWYKKTYPDASAVLHWESSMVNAFLKEEYKLIFRSSSMRAVKGGKINKPDDSAWKVRVDFYNSLDSKLFMMFCIKFAPVVIDDTWFDKNRNNKLSL